MVGTVGPPLPIIDVCLESVPEMGYDALGDTPRGEICIRGKCLFSGYYKREDLTKEVLVDGWFHTGVTGQISVFKTQFLGFWIGSHFAYYINLQQVMLVNGSRMEA